VQAALTLSHLPLQLLASMVATAAIIGTQRLGRPFTDEEKKHFGQVLREHDYVGVRLIALRMAFRLTRSRAAAANLVSRVDLRLVLNGWDPNQVSLVRCMCHLTWVEWTHDGRETEASRRAEEGYLRELGVAGATAAPSAEQRVTEHEARVDVETKAAARLKKLRAVFVASGDEVNLLWLDAAEATAEGMPDLQKLAASTGRDVTEFYAAAKRRRRAVTALIAEERGVKWTDEE
jgi:hypothetical protein